MTSSRDSSRRGPRIGRDFSGIQTIAPSALADLLRRQPCSPSKVGLVWQIVAGPNLARSAKPEFQPPRTVRLIPCDARWRRELERSRGVLRARLGPLLGLDDLLLEISS